MNPIPGIEFPIEWRTNIGPFLTDGFHLVCQPAFRLTATQEVECAKQDQESSQSERKTQRNIADPYSEYERKQIGNSGWCEDELPVGRMNSEPLESSKDIWTRMSFSHIYLALEIGIDTNRTPLGKLPENRNDCSKGE